MDWNVSDIVKPFAQFISNHAEGQTYSDESISDFLSQQNLCADAEDYLFQCLLGWRRKHPAVKVVSRTFLEKLASSSKGKCQLKKLSSEMKVFIYLLLFEENSLNEELIGEIVSQQVSKETYLLLVFLSDTTNVTLVLHQAWLETYDETYVYDSLVQPLVRQSRILAKLCTQISGKVFTKKEPRAKSLTVVKPFNLTQLRPRTVSVPNQKIPMEVQIKASAIPLTTYCQPQILLRLQEKMQENKARAKKLLQDITCYEHHYQRPQKSEKALKKLAAILNEEENQFQFSRWKASKMPNFNKPYPEVKNNAAVILRENALVQKQMNEQMTRLKALEQGAFDKLPEQSVQEEQARLEREQHMLDMETTHLQRRLQKEEAFIARQNAIHEKWENVQHIKEEKEKMMKDVMKEQLLKEEQIKKTIEKIMTDQNNMKKAMQDLTEEKRKQVRDLQLQYQEMKKRADEIAREEMVQRKALIQEIRNLESSFKYGKIARREPETYDGFSFVQLQHHLEKLKLEQKQAEEAKRKEIQEAKRKKDDHLTMIKSINKAYKMQAAQNEKNKINQQLTQQKLHKKHLEENSRIQLLQQRLSMAMEKRRKLEQTTTDERKRLSRSLLSKKHLLEQTREQLKEMLFMEPL